MKNVNSLRPNETLTFGPQGVTVVFGFNGSGKSGYARLIKQMVQTRHREEILPDVFGEHRHAREGQLDYLVGNDVAEADLSGSSPLALGRVAFYDEKCGDAYLQTESEIAYRPSTLTLLDDLYSICEGVRREFDAMLLRNSRAAWTPPFLHPGSQPAEFVSSLTRTTSDQEIDEACRLPDNHAHELAVLRDEESRLRLTDPQREKDRLSKLATDFDSVAAHLKYLQRTLGADAALTIRRLGEAARAKREAASTASSVSFQGEPLQGVGNLLWRALWDAARRFSEAEAYPSEPHPHTADGARCVLCQQELSDEASGRLRRFEAFMVDDTERQARRAESELLQAVEHAKAVDIEPPTVAVAIAAVCEDSVELKAQLKSVLHAFRSGQRELADETINEQQGEVDAAVLINALEARSQEQRARSESIEAGDFAERIDVVARRFRDLDSKIAIASSKDAIVAERDRLRERYQIDSARKATGTAGLTLKISDLTRKYVTVAVQDQFSRESDRLRVERVTLQDKKGRQGVLLHKPDFVGATVTADLSRVLSEGEQTALGLAGFFTEARFDRSKSAIVLDDPVTSLDHERRGRVAKRLVSLASERQVIVFTHDSTFVAEIRRCAGETKVPFTTRAVERGRPGQQPGVCRDSHPWSVKDAAARLGQLKQDLVRMRKESPNWDFETYEREAATWAGRLSETWERIVSQDIADALVNRGTLEISVTMMKVVARITSDDNKEFQESYKRCSRWALRHDKDALLNYSAPPIEDLEDEHRFVNQWFERVRKYKN